MHLFDYLDSGNGFKVRLLLAQLGMKYRWTQVDIDKDKLEWDAAILSTEKAIHDQALAKYEYGQKDAELKGANLAMQRRQINAPFDGEVTTIYRHQDEWVSPGDAILRLVRRRPLAI